MYLAHGDIFDFRFENCKSLIATIQTITAKIREKMDDIEN